jgi:hypothetical protein
MTPKEKAKQLVSQMYGCEVEDLNDVFLKFADEYFIGRDAALIAVNLHLEELSKMKLIFSDREIHYKFWQEVKKEIEKL